MPRRAQEGVDECVDNGGTKGSAQLCLGNNGSRKAGRYVEHCHGQASCQVAPEEVALVGGQPLENGQVLLKSCEQVTTPAPPGLPVVGIVGLE